MTLQTVQGSPVKVMSSIPKTITLTPAQMQMLTSQQRIVSSNISHTSANIIQTQAPIQQQQTQVVQSQQTSQPVVQQLQQQSNKNYISPILDHSGSRKRQEIEPDHMPAYKRRKSDKVGKGLRHFSMKVCEKVRKKGSTSYNEVADELVAEFTNPSNLHNNSPSDQYDQKNIRRRVYDALNVLMAMNIISKEKKEIRWLGLPTNSVQECTSLERDKHLIGERIKQKTQQLHELILQQISFKNLVERNRGQESKYGVPAPNTAIQLPFIIVNTSKKTVIDCRISNDKMEYLFNFDDKFEIHDDIEVLKRMGMVLGLDKGECTDEELLKAKSMVPRSLENYVVQLAQGNTEPDLPELSAGPSSSSVNASFLVDEFDTPMGLSRHSSHTDLSEEPLSPSLETYSDDDSEMSSDVEMH
ncbi:hypothetical protein FOCC_FOCC004688 [Frankliniella occidentalis]|uniref:Transcription factor Dp-1 n=1 Tax=Frankliniella occidentalis TaxID=133901 RepID=A0A9C6TX96_FRAOC|nr:transcription factor Dp-1 [Frankliniella occidentalis]KAE8748675.1 hypothetical protein FOCC_FOCC004688 [Frankliniella occidentalis]